MVIGHQGVGKTSLAKRLLGEEVDNETKSTEGIDFHHLQINHDTGEWSKTDSDRAKLNRHSMAEVLHEYGKGERPEPQNCAESQDNSGNSIVQNSEDNTTVGAIAPADVSDKKVKKKDRKRDTNPEIRNIVREAESFTPHGSLSSPLTLMDFAGQFLYYTTHQTFISRRTIYLLVTDMRLPLRDPVKKDRFCSDMSGNEPCIVQDYVVYWLNSIHSHVFLPIELDSDQREGDVILVGTHLDLIPKLIHYIEVENVNESLEVKLESTDELDVFLKFEHELGHCIFFSTENLRAHVMLDPQWLIRRTENLDGIR